jgi:hypothetical protein
MIDRTATANWSVKYNIRLSEYPDYALRVADIIGLWATLEHLLTNLFTILSGTDPFKGAQLVGSLESSGARLSMVRAAGKMTLGDAHPLSKEFQAVMDAAEKCLKQRNKYAHAVYAVNEKNQLCRVHMRHELPSPEALTVLSLQALDDLVTRLVAIHRSATALIEAVFKQLPSEYVQAWHAMSVQRTVIGLQPGATASAGRLTGPA